ncbi:TetR/AcrR family transcriptional regulator [Streptomyces platensis]|uniref:TetR/AcrR family transcriptional regulator n=1 Tax=Streptomyces platensis TaxID=58346 RepID=UPI001F228FBD|nr:TetR/AcrR family transcriptional regulator [Streptomyces platensis]MCF3148493.1 TetR/AcrR family transcriptional regulator C-terminal domain-containing protein [Streptomyces platensis]
MSAASTPSPSSPSSSSGARSATTGRGRPPKLDQARTVEVALALLDEVGLDALTMRRLAEAMDVRAGALYRYFATKHELLTAMAEVLLADCLDRPFRSPDWSERVAELAHRMRTALLGHRDGARVYAGTHATGAHTLGFADALIGVLRAAGFTADDAGRAALTVVHFTLGHTLEEQAARRGADAGPADPERLRAAVTPGQYPHLATALPVLTSTDFTAHFEFGLGLLLQGLRALGPGAPPPGTGG